MSIPAARKQLVIVLQYLLEQVVPQRTCPERELNDLLVGFNQDLATLHRELVDDGYLVRKQGIYQVASGLLKRSGNPQQQLPANEARWLCAMIQASLIRE